MGLLQVVALMRLEERIDCMNLGRAPRTKKIAQFDGVNRDGCARLLATVEKLNRGRARSNGIKHLLE